MFAFVSTARSHKPMSKTPAPFTQADVRRAIGGALAAGARLAGASIDRQTGNIELKFADSEATSGDGTEYDRWKKQDHDGSTLRQNAA